MTLQFQFPSKYEESGDMQSARQAFEAAVQFDPQSDSAHYNLGVHYASTAGDAEPFGEAADDNQDLYHLALHSLRKATVLK